MKWQSLLQAYSAALGMYDLPLAYMVIASSQLDPSEHLLQLQTFASVEPEAMQRHRVDVHLGRWLPALEHAVRAGPTHAAASLTFAREHGLLRQLVMLLDDENPSHVELRPVAMTAYAQVSNLS